MTAQFHSLQDKVAIVTGSSRGIGAGIAYELARRGAKVAITYTTSNSTKQAHHLIQQIQSLSTSAIAIKADLRNPSSATQIVHETTHAFGPHIDILVNNAAVELVKPIPDIEGSDFDYVFELNVRAPALMVQAVLPYLRAPGRIINIGSVAARCGFARMSVYCASKAALEGLTRSWAAELGMAGHTVNQVNPGPTATEMLENIPGEIVDMQKAQTPVERRIGRVDDVAQVVGWLGSEESRWITGQVVAATGGWAMY
ncbi:hypothetical protein ASPWEDRAFT_155162 [Aspergillus wentii DTO 134E9]|uniref:Ketoreductase domain-containing protein n=1 Tax=Aspergillus wentii DTO 134E9 TaxID=1073089 RepID=A0A1L9RKN0_ASPWE|nr:uncharacterized protein ASPWEDRAFT_155162 [Aspergillus wentii DTO 134E9]OJJ35408.1 hypothetical protein ASPWEDRAFT_155162 [Aspergillus wentii DTO 134E9]